MYSVRKKTVARGNLSPNSELSVLVCIFIYAFKGKGKDCMKLSLQAIQLLAQVHTMTGWTKTPMLSHPPSCPPPLGKQICTVQRPYNHTDTCTRADVSPGDWTSEEALSE